MQWINFNQSASQREKIIALDDEQQKTKNLTIPGHALIRGVAGSGKSFILRDRLTKIIEKNYDNVLILCYNRYMHYMHDPSVVNRNKPVKRTTKIECRTFHSWAYRHFKYWEYDNNPGDRKSLIESAKNSGLKYQAIIVDEAQDFYDEWFQALVAVLDPQTNSLSLAYDNTQAVYGQTHRKKGAWKWADVGVNIPGGRSRVFAINHRNAPEILEVAWKFIKPSIEKTGMKTAQKGKDDTSSLDKIIEPKKNLSRSSGISPLLVQSDREQMPVEIAQQVKMAKQDYQDARIGILVHPKTDFLKSEISDYLMSMQIKAIAPETSQDRKSDILDRGAVVIDSWNAMKGMEFDAVIIAGVDYAISSEDPDEDFKERAGLYVAMTRAKDHLVMLYEKETDIVNQINQALTSEDCLESVQ